MGRLVVEHMGAAGVNVDKNPLELADDELLQAQNAISDPAAGRSSLRKRPGLIEFSELTTTVLGGAALVYPDQINGNVTIYIGRGPTS